MLSQDDFQSRTPGSLGAPHPLINEGRRVRGRQPAKPRSSASRVGTPFAVSDRTTVFREWLDPGASVVISSSSSGRYSAPVRSATNRSAPDLRVDVESYTATWRGQGFHLTRIELGLLSVLIEQPRRVLSYRDLNQRVWGSEYGGDADRVRSAVKRLRGRLRAVGVELEIRAVRGVGFRATDSLL